MKRGRFDESIASYKKALSIDPNFVASHIGIGNDYLYMGRSDEARAEFTKIDKVARNTGEHRLSHFWMAASYVVDGATDKAVAEMKAQYALAEREHDGASMSGDLNLMGDILREAGRLDESSAKYAEAVSVIDKAEVPKAQGRYPSQPCLRAGPAGGGAERLADREGQGERVRDPDLSSQGAIRAAADARALGPGQPGGETPAVAAEELKQSNQQDPRIIYLTSVAVQQAGDTQTAASLAAKAAKFNGLAFSYGYIKNKASKAVGTGM